MELLREYFFCGSDFTMILNQNFRVKIFDKGFLKNQFSIIFGSKVVIFESKFYTRNSFERLLKLEFK